MKTYVVFFALRLIVKRLYVSVSPWTSPFDCPLSICVTFQVVAVLCPDCHVIRDYYLIVPLLRISVAFLAGKELETKLPKPPTKIK